MEVEMKIRGLMMDPVNNMPIVILKDVHGNTVLPIWVGVYEANAIALEIEKVTTPRPMTHDLIKNAALLLYARRFTRKMNRHAHADLLVHGDALQIDVQQLALEGLVVPIHDHGFGFLLAKIEIENGVVA